MSVWLALGTVYVVWGSTYLAIRIAIHTLPPLLMASARFLIAGAILYAWSIGRREANGDRQADRPRPKQWLAALAIGGALLLGGNGGVVLAERTVASGLVALLVATVPLSIAIIDRLVSGRRLNAAAVAGLLMGFGGVALLLGVSGSNGVDPVGLLLALLAASSWAAGSTFSRRAGLPSRLLVSTAMQMLCGGVLLGIAAAASGEMTRIHLEAFSRASLLAFGYLVVFGSILAFSAYVWLLRSAPISLVSTYAYINPVVAVFLGWALLGEAVTLRMLVAGAIIVAAVAFIVGATSKRAEKRASRLAA